MHDALYASKNGVHMVIEAYFTCSSKDYCYQIKTIMNLVSCVSMHVKCMHVRESI